MRNAWPTILFALLVVLFGLPMAVSEDPAWRNFWGGLAVFSVGGFSLSLIRDSVRSGRLKFRTSVITSARQPLLFKATLALLAVAGMGALTLGTLALAGYFTLGAPE